MTDLLFQTLPHFQHELRWIAFVLMLANLAWVGPRALDAVRGDISGKAAAFLGLFILLLGQLASQTTYLFEGVPDLPHWRRAANLVILIIGALVLLASHALFAVERHIRRSS